MLTLMAAIDIARAFEYLAITAGVDLVLFDRQTKPLLILKTVDQNLISLFFDQTYFYDEEWNPNWVNEVNTQVVFCKLTGISENKLSENISYLILPQDWRSEAGTYKKVIKDLSCVIQTYNFLLHGFV